MTLALLGFYSVLVVAVAILGAILPRLIPLTHTRMQLLMSLVAGFMLGVSMLHLIPHAYAELGSLDQTMLLVLVGLLAMFFLMRLFHVHTHEFEEIEVVEGEEGHEHESDNEHGKEHGKEPSKEHNHEGEPAPHVHGPDCKHDHDHDAAHGHAHDHGHHHHDHDHVDTLLQGGSMAWMGLFAGLAVHTITDGMFLAASVAAESEHQSWLPAGLGTFLAVFLHKPLDTLSIAILMRAAGWSTRATWIAATIFGLMCPLGSAIFMLGLEGAGDREAQIVGMALALGGGFFLCISLADLLPELSFHTHDRAKLSIALLAGIVISYLIGFLEPKHSHEHKPSTEAHDHAGHSH